MLVLSIVSQNCPQNLGQSEKEPSNFVIISFGNLTWLLSRAWTCGGCWLVSSACMSNLVWCSFPSKCSFCSWAWASFSFRRSSNHFVTLSTSLSASSSFASSRSFHSVRQWSLLSPLISPPLHRVACDWPHWRDASRLRGVSRLPHIFPSLNDVSLHHCHLQLCNFNLHVRFGCLHVVRKIQDVIILTQFVLCVFCRIVPSDVPRFVNFAPLTRDCNLNNSLSISKLDWVYD